MFKKNSELQAFHYILSVCGSVWLWKFCVWYYFRTDIFDCLRDYLFISMWILRDEEYPKY